MEPQENREDQVACCARHVASAGQTSSQDRVFPSAKVRSPGGELVRPFAKIFSGFFLLQNAAGIYFQIVFGFTVSGVKVVLSMHQNPGTENAVEIYSVSAI